MFHDQQRDYATTLKHAYEHTSIFAQEVGHPAELMLMCQSVPVFTSEQNVLTLHACIALNNAAARRATAA